MMRAFVRAIPRIITMLAVVWLGATFLPQAAAQCATGRCDDSSLFDRCCAAWHRKLERIRCKPLNHYAHGAGDLTERPICPPYCSPNAGYFEPCWHRLAPGPGCPRGYLGTELYPAVDSPVVVPMPAPAVNVPDANSYEPAPATETVPPPSPLVEPETLPSVVPSGYVIERATKGAPSNMWREARH